MPFAFAGALDGHVEHIFDEHGISCLKYNSRTIFWTFPLLVDLIKTLLEILVPWGSPCDVLFQLVITNLLKRSPILQRNRRSIENFFLDIFFAPMLKTWSLL